MECSCYILTQRIPMPMEAGLRFGLCQVIFCKVEFNQLSCWLYSVSNLLVFQQLVTLYLGGIVVRVVSEIVCKKTETRDWISLVTYNCKPLEDAHVPGMPEVEASC